MQRCEFFHQSDGCRHGDHCRHAHHWSELVGDADEWGCKHWEWRHWEWRRLQTGWRPPEPFPVDEPQTEPPGAEQEAQPAAVDGGQAQPGEADDGQQETDRGEVVHDTSDLEPRQLADGPPPGPPSDEEKFHELD